MATERILIEVKETGARVVQRNVKEIGNSAEKSNQQVSGLIRALVFGAAARATIQLADSYTNLQNRLRGSTNSAEELRSAQERLFEISTRTRTSVNENADAFDRLTVAARDLGISQDRTLNLLETMVKALKAAGATSAEAASGIKQLSIGLATGSLRSLELRTILRQFPEIFDLIAQEMGVTRAGLQALGEDGRISAGVILQAFENAGATVDEKFGRLLPTVGEQATVLRNSLVDLVGALNETADASGRAIGRIEDLARAITIVADNVRKSGFRGFVEGFFGGFQELEAIEAEAKRINALLLEQQRRREGGATETEALRGDPRLAAADAARRAAEAAAVATAAETARTEATRRLTDVTAALNIELERELELAGLGAREQEVRRGLFQVDAALAKANIDLKSDEAQAVRAGAEGQLREIQAIKDRQAILDEIRGPEEERVRRTGILNQLLAEGAISQDQFTEAIKRMNQELKESVTFGEALRQKFLEIDTSAQALGGAIGGVLVGAVDQLSGAIADLAISGFRDFESFKQALSDILRSIGREIIKLIVQFLILKAVQAGLGAFAGGGGGADTSTTSAGTGSAFGTALSGGLQAGGFALAGEPVLVGERGPEIFEPTRSGNVIPNSELAAPETNITIVNVTDPDEVTAALSTAEGEQAIMNVISKNRRDVAELARR